MKTPFRIAQFTFNAFSENTYIIADSKGNAIIIDPGMTDVSEDSILFDYIEEEKLAPQLILNTHCHLDHILGNTAVAERYNIAMRCHALELPVIERAASTSLMFGIPYRPTVMPAQTIEENEVISVGDISFNVLFVPGHAPGHLAFVCHEEKVVFSGDVLFKGSVGRVDLPGCNAADLVRSIQTKMYALPDDYVVYSGHGPQTTIGDEKQENFFVRPDWAGL
jgi:glyoxylase-like metal-dependent hydrolase (beta-lactamase superfamily II)